MLDIGYWMLDAGYSILDTRYSILDTGCSILDTGYWMLDIGCWMLDACPSGRSPSLDVPSPASPGEPELAEGLKGCTLAALTLKSNKPLKHHGNRVK